MRRMALTNGTSAASAAAAGAANGNAAAAAGPEQDEVSDDEDCEVECIVAHSLAPERYRVRWVGFPPSEDSWLTREELEGSAGKLLRQYLISVKKAELQSKPREIFLDVEAVVADGSGGDEEEDEEERGRLKKKQKKQQASNKDDDADGKIRSS